MFQLTPTFIQKNGWKAVTFHAVYYQHPYNRDPCTIIAAPLGRVPVASEPALASEPAYQDVELPKLAIVNTRTLITEPLIAKVANILVHVEDLQRSTT